MFSAALLVVAMASSNAYDPIFHDAFDAASDCPGGRRLVAEVSYGPGDTGDVDVTEWANLWGRASLSDPPVPWPGLPVAPTFVDFDRTTYVAARFTVPEGTPTTWMGWLTHTDYHYGRNLEASISTSCGDFSPSNAACWIDAMSGQPIVPWRTSPGAFCPLAPGDYYLNIRAADPSAGCWPASESCDVQLSNVANTR
jgi:hypothetical protein